MKPASPERHGIRGFTLVETLVVLVISVGLVAIMTSLYRSVAHAAMALGGNKQEWAFQEQLRDQLRHGFTLPGGKSGALFGEGRRLVFLTWKSRITGFDGKPVVADYRYDPQARSLSYREAPLPAWWEDNSALNESRRLSALVQEVTEKPLVSGVEAAAFSFFPSGAAISRETIGADDWSESGLPGLIVVQFMRNQHDHMLWLEPRVANQ